jgi:phosphohistidine swiveling domain-containing protein
MIANARVYGDDFGEFMNFRFSVLAYLSREGLVEYWRTAEDQAKFLSKLRDVILQNPDKIVNTLKDSKRYNQVLKSEIEKINEQGYENFSLSELGRLFAEKYQLFQNQFLPSVVVPFTVCVASEKYELDKNDQKVKKILSLSKESRLVSLYTEYRKVVLGLIMAEISAKASLDGNIINFLTPEEIVALCDGDRKVLENSAEKNNNYIFLKFPKEEILLFGKETVGEFVAFFHKDGFHLEEERIKGSVAYPGKATGRVKIVYSENDFEKFNQGDILVTIHSNPALMTVIKKCGAIVADEGGISSHAAIVSREFKIPCIMGTKIATKILRDGDLVEVDAENGVVNIIG